MQTKTQLINKRSALEQWLRDNPNHPNRPDVQRDLRKVNDQLLEKITK